MFVSSVPISEASTAWFFLGINTYFWCFLFLHPALLKLIPIPVWQKACTRLIILISEGHKTCNSGWMRLTQPNALGVTGLEGLQEI